jgi:predicted RNA binding protein YcfA (HicA-like mRNA interferase family)
MQTDRRTVALGVLIAEAAIAVVAILFHYGFTAEYGDITQSSRETASDALRGGLLPVVAVLGILALVLSRQLSMRLMAVAIPVLFLVALLVITPAALRQKLEQYTTTPQCVSPDMQYGPGAQAEAESQAAFDSIEHVGHFGGGGGSGVVGCDRRLLLTEDVDVLEHYRTALSEAGWTVVEDDGSHVRAHRAQMAFEVVPCQGGGVVWAGGIGAEGGASCDESEQVNVG